MKVRERHWTLNIRGSGLKWKECIVCEKKEWRNGTSTGCWQLERKFTAIWKNYLNTSLTIKTHVRCLNRDEPFFFPLLSTHSSILCSPYLLYSAFAKKLLWYHLFGDELFFFNDFEIMLPPHPLPVFWHNVLLFELQPHLFFCPFGALIQGINHSIIILTAIKDSYQSLLAHCHLI